MNFPFLQTDTYYPGFQKLRVLEDRMIRRAVLSVTALALITVPLYLLLPEKYNESIMLVRDILALVPLVYLLCGGVSRRAWRLFALFGALFLAGFLPLIHGASPVFWVFIAASGVALVPLLREIPHVMDQLGYTSKVHPVKEALAFFSLCSIMLFMANLAVSILLPKWLPDAALTNLGLRKYALLLCLCLVHYGALYGILYGILFRRLISMRFTLAVPILVNCFLLLMTWMPDVLDNSNPVMAFVALVFTGSAVQFVLGMGFYFCRSTRALLIAYLVYFIYYKSVFLGF